MHVKSQSAYYSTVKRFPENEFTARDNCYHIFRFKHNEITVIGCMDVDMSITFPALDTDVFIDGK